MSSKEMKMGRGAARELILRCYVDSIKKLERRPKRQEMLKLHPELDQVGERTINTHLPKFRKMTYEELGLPGFSDKVKHVSNPPPPKTWKPEPEKWLKTQVSRVIKLKIRFEHSAFADDMNAWSTLHNVQRELEKQIMKVQVGILDAEQVKLVSWDIVDKWVKNKATEKQRRKRAASRGNYDAKERVENSLWQLECQYQKVKETYDPKIVYAISGYIRTGINEVKDLAVLGGTLSEGSLEHSHSFYQEMIKNLDVKEFLRKKYKEINNDRKQGK